MAKGTGDLKVGLVFWDADYRVTACDWGTTDDTEETWALNPTSWTHIATHRHAPEGHVAMVRLELQGAGPLSIAKVLAERGYLKDWLYFDGDEKYGARDDFSWYMSGRGGLGHQMKAGVNFINEPHLFATFNSGVDDYFYTHLTDERSGPIQTITRNGGAPNLSRSLTARDSVNSAVLLSRSTVNWATPTPRRGATPGIGSRPPWGAERMIGNVPAQNIKSLSPSGGFCALA